MLNKFSFIKALKVTLFTGLLCSFSFVLWASPQIQEPEVKIGQDLQYENTSLQIGVEQLLPQNVILFKNSFLNQDENNASLEKEEPVLVDGDRCGPGCNGGA